MVLALCMHMSKPIAMSPCTRGANRPPSPAVSIGICLIRVGLPLVLSPDPGKARKIPLGKVITCTKNRDRRAQNSTRRTFLAAFARARYADVQIGGLLKGPGLHLAVGFDHSQKGHLFLFFLETKLSASALREPTRPCTWPITAIAKCGGNCPFPCLEMPA